MKKLIAIALFGFALSGFAIVPASAAPEPVSQVSIPIVAVEAPLSFPRVTVTTSSAPKSVVVPEVVETAPVVTEVPQVIESQVNPVPTAGPEGGIQCEEDMPCWDCKTMGNKICGTKKSAPVSELCIEVYEDGSCITENGFIEPGSSEEIITAPVETEEPEVFETPIEDEPVENNGNPECQVPGSIQWADGSCVFENPVEKDVQPAE